MYVHRYVLLLFLKVHPLLHAYTQVFRYSKPHQGKNVRQYCFSRKQKKNVFSQLPFMFVNISIGIVEQRCGNSMHIHNTYNAKRRLFFFVDECWCFCFEHNFCGLRQNEYICVSSISNKYEYVPCDVKYNKWEQNKETYRHRDFLICSAHYM